jgi:hypothetical protein
VRDQVFLIWYWINFQSSKWFWMFV